MTDESFFAGFLAGGAGLRTGALALTLEATAFFWVETAFFAADFGADALRAGALFAALPLAEAVEPDFVTDLGALRAGALSDDERLTIGLGRAFLPANVRFFAEDVGEF
ncbi:MAG TPA: hypothetical protein VF766_16270 [Pyrinomonadaceae bacterium]